MKNEYRRKKKKEELVSTLINEFNQNRQNSEKIAGLSKRLELIRISSSSEHIKNSYFSIIRQASFI